MAANDAERDGDHEVTFRVDGEPVTTEVDADEYLLDAAERAGLDLPYSCRNGMCTSCVGELEAGAVDDSEATALDPGQVADGYVLLCCSRPESDCEVVAGDGIQEEMLGLDVF